MRSVTGELRRPASQARSAKRRDYRPAHAVPRPHRVGRLALASGPAMVLVTVVALGGFAATACSGVLHSHVSLVSATDQLLVVVLCLGFFVGSLAYELARHGCLQRYRAADRLPPAGLTRLFGADPEPFVVLVPAYKENARITRRTLLSAALQQYPGGASCF